MNRKQLTIILVLVAVLGAAGLALLKSNQKSWSPSSKQGQKVLENVQINDVAQIHLIGDSELNLVKKDDSWRVQERGDYPANFAQIRGFLVKLADLKVVQSEQVDPSQLAGLELVEPGKGTTGKAATVIELKDQKGKVMNAVLLGIKHTRKVSSPFGGDQEYPDGRYIMVRGDSENALLISDPLGNSDPKPDQWLNKEFVRVEKIKSVDFVAANSINSWKLVSTNEAGPLALSDSKTNEVIDASKVSSLSATLSALNFVDVAVNPTSEQTGLDKPLLLNIDTFNHFNYVLKIGKKTPENNYYMTVAVSANLPKERIAGKDEKPEDKAKLDKEFSEKNKQLEEKLKQEKSLEKWTYLVSTTTLDPLIRDRAQLMQEAPKAPDAKEDSSADEDTANEVQEMPIVPEQNPLN